MNTLRIIKQLQPNNGEKAFLASSGIALSLVAVILNRTNVDIVLYRITLPLCGY